MPRGAPDEAQVDRRSGAGPAAISGGARRRDGGGGGGGVRRPARARPVDGADDDGAAARQGAARPPPGRGGLPVHLARRGGRGDAGGGEVVRREDAGRLRLPVRDLPDGGGRGLGGGPRRARRAGGEAPLAAQGGGMSIPGVVETLARASVEGAIFVTVVWLVCRLVPRLPPAVRCGLWWAACL